MKTNHILQLESLIKRNVSDLIQNELRKNVGLVTVTDVDLTSDYSYCTIYYTVLDPKDKKKAFEGLNASRKFFRSALASRITMKRSPELSFKYDDSYEKGARIEELLESIKKETPNN